MMIVDYVLVMNVQLAMDLKLVIHVLDVMLGKQIVLLHLTASVMTGPWVNGTLRLETNAHNAILIVHLVSMLDFLERPW